MKGEMKNEHSIGKYALYNKGLCKTSQKYFKDSNCGTQIQFFASLTKFQMKV